MAKSSVAAPADNWQAQSDMRTLMEAHQIRSDGKRHKAAKAHAKKQLTAMQKIAEAKEGPDLENAADRKQEGY